MNLQRMKFAWARGARIQCNRHIEAFEKWEDCLPHWGTVCTWRIHPDDEHLQYGYLSKALLDGATYDKVKYIDTFDAAMKLLRHHVPMGFVVLTEEDSMLSRMFACFFAECIADEGL